MFCPKCGTKNPDDGKFCRTCGTDLATVNAAMSGDRLTLLGDLGLDGSCSVSESRRRKDPSEVYGDGIKGVITGVGFLVVSMALLFTGVANGKSWWWALLFPAFFGFAKGVLDIMRSQKMFASQNANSFTESSSDMIGKTSYQPSLSSPQTEFVVPESRYKTGDLVPHSVTDNTTRHLEVSAEGETMTLPKR